MADCGMNKSMAKNLVRLLYLYYGKGLVWYHRPLRPDKRRAFLLSVYTGSLAP
jgi:hypothetical protein